MTEKQHLNIAEHFDKIKINLEGAPSKVGEMAVYKYDNIVSLAIKAFGEYCDAELDIMSTFLDEKSTYLDIGTNIGYHLVGMYKRNNCRVIGFEPHPNHFAVASYNAQHYPITIYNAALSNKKSTIKLADFDMEKPGNYGEVKVDSEGFDIDAITLDSLKFPEVTLMKIDVEGHELNVLKGAKKTIERCRPIIFFEANEMEWEQAYKYLDQFDYKFHWVGCRNKPVRETFIKTDQNPFGDSGVTNILAVPKENKEQLDKAKVLIEVVPGESYNEAAVRYRNYRWLF